MSDKDLWLDNNIQFPRLLCEIDAVGIDSERHAELCENMDLNYKQLDELFERAHVAWEAHKGDINAKTKV